MAFTYRTTPLPAAWPGKITIDRKKALFKCAFARSINDLGYEVDHLNGRNVEIAIGVREQDLRIDGGVRSSARVQNPAIVVSFMVGADRLSFPCDTFNWWEDNIRAVALALEALRAVDRYGVQQGKQYEGFKAIGSGAERAPDITPDIHALNIARLNDGEVDAGDILRNPDVAKRAIRSARGRTHPDAGGSEAEWAMVQTAAAGLSRHHGVPL